MFTPLIFITLCILSTETAVAEDLSEDVSDDVPQDDLVSLEPYLLEVVVVPNEEDEAMIGGENKTGEYDSWKEQFEETLKEAFEQANMATKPANTQEPVVKIMKTELVKLDESNSVRVQFYIVLPPDGLVPGMKVEKIYRNLAISELWDKMGRDVLLYPTALDTEEGEKVDDSSRTLSIVAFIMGWVCLAALIVILAYLGIKYRDGIKSLARRIEVWSNPNRNGYSDLGGEVHSHTTDWRTDTESRGESVEVEREEVKPKKKLRAPGGLLTEMDEGEGIVNKPQSYSTYGTSSDISTSYGTTTDATKEPSLIKDSTQVRLSELAGNTLMDTAHPPRGTLIEAGDVTPPMTPTSMQKHLIKKYQDKQGEGVPVQDEPLAATNSEIFPDDFADCVEEEEIFRVQP